ncbi:MAG: hypothetical protein HYU79_01395 [Nitrosomonadales bacterium]|nr:hypothetical protein [Nitrosomonadales bacterium]
MIRKKTIHHEEHEGHEDFCELSPFGDIPANPKSFNLMALDVHRQDAVFLRVLRALRSSSKVFA